MATAVCAALNDLLPAFVEMEVSSIFQNIGPVKISQIQLATKQSLPFS